MTHPLLEFFIRYLSLLLPISAPLQHLLQCVLLFNVPSFVHPSSPLFFRPLVRPSVRVSVKEAWTGWHGSLAQAHKTPYEPPRSPLRRIVKPFIYSTASSPRRSSTVFLNRFRGVNAGPDISELHRDITALQRANQTLRFS